MNKLKEKNNEFEIEKKKRLFQAQQDKTIEFIGKETFKNIEKVDQISYGNARIIYKVAKKDFYALKEMKPQITHEELRQFIAEYEVMRTLEHPNIVKNYGIHLIDEKNPPSILLELCPSNLDSAIKNKNENKKMSKVQLVFSIYQIVEGMKYVHFRNVIHRDLKPENIFILEDGTIKIGDFGISKLMSAGEQMTKGVGTLKFMAPEILREKEYDEKVDVYSFGVILFFMLNEGEMPDINIVRIGNGEKAEIPNSFTEFSRQLISSCWNTDPKDRPSFEQIYHDIENNDFNIVEMNEEEKEEVKTKIKDHKSKIQSQIYSYRQQIDIKEQSTSMNGQSGAQEFILVGQKPGLHANNQTSYTNPYHDNGQFLVNSNSPSSFNNAIQSPSSDSNSQYYQQKISEKDSKIRELESNIESLQSQISSYRKQNELDRKSIEHLSSQSGQKGKLQKQIIDKDNEIAQLRAQILSLGDTIKEKEKMNVNLSRQSDEFQQAVLDKSNQVVKLVEQVNALQDLKRELDNEKEANLAKIQTYEDQIQKLKKENDKYKDKVDKKKSKYVLENESLNFIGQEQEKLILKLEEEIKTQNTDLDKIRLELNQKTTDIENLTNEKKQLEEKVSELSELNLNYENKVKEITEENGELTSTVTDLEKNKDKLNKMIQTQKEIINKQMILAKNETENQLEMMRQVQENEIRSIIRDFDMS